MADQAIVEEFKKLFQDQNLQQEFVANQGAYVGENFPPGCTPQDLAEGAQEALQSSGINQGAYVGYGGGAPAYSGGEAGLVSQIAYYTSVYNNTTIDDRDVAINNQINALGDVDVDNTVASGDGSVAIGGDAEDVGIATGANSTAAGDVEGSVAGAGGTAIGGDGPTTVTDSQVQSANAGGDVDQQQQDGLINVGDDVDLPEPPPPPPPPPDADPADVT